MEISLVLHQPKGEISHKITHTARLEVINPTISPPADPTTDPQLVLHPMNRSSHKPIARHHLMLFVSPQLMILLTNCQIFAP